MRPLPRHETIEGPCGPFLIPADPPKTREVCTGLSLGVWGYPGAYGRPESRVPEYEHEALSHLDLPPKARVLDIGAGWGAFAVWAFASWGEDIELHCYEPATIACDFLLANVEIAANHFEALSGKRGCCANLHLHEMAVSARADIVLGHSEDWGSRKTHALEEGRAGDRIGSISPFHLPPCEIIKCDAEGIEPELFAAYPHFADVRAAIYEWHSPEHRAELQGILSRRTGLRCVRDEDGPWGGGNGVAVWVR